MDNKYECSVGKCSAAVMEQRKMFGDRLVALDLMKEMMLDEALVDWSFKVMEQERPLQSAQGII